jgi:LysM repeat protein
MVSSAFLRTICFLSIGLFAPVFLTQCKTPAKSYKDVSYDPVKLKTPAGHGLERKDYPFDENGAYRKDWVKSNTGGRDRSASPEVPPPAALASAGKLPSKKSGSVKAGGTEPGLIDPGPTAYPTYAEAAAARASGDSGAPAESASLAAIGAVPASSGDPEAPSNTGRVELASAGTGMSTSLSAVLPIPTSVPEPTAPVAPAATRYHKVRSGDTLFALASRYNTSVPALKRVNGLSSDNIRAGQSLRLP